MLRFIKPWQVLGVFSKRMAVRLPNGGIRMVIVDCMETATAEAPEKATLPAAKPKHIGGGWYELPDGRRVRKKDLEAGD